MTVDNIANLDQRQ